MYKTDIFAIGELLIDFVEKGKNENGYPILSAYPGGAPCNFLAVNSIYGNKCKLLSCVGNDKFGELLKDTLKDCKIDLDYIQVTDKAFTSLAFVTLDKIGDRDFSFSRKPGADTLIEYNDEVIDAIKNSRVVHYGSLSFTNEPSMSTTKKLIEVALKEKVWVNYDPNYRKLLWNSEKEAKDAIMWGLNHANSIKISKEEVELIYGKCEKEEYDKLLSLPNVKFILITRGNDKVTILTKTNILDIEANKLENTIDTTGAGDIFGGSAIYYLLNKNVTFNEIKIKDLQDAVIFANAAAALSTTKYGGISSIPNKAEVEKFIKERIYD